MSYQAIKDLVGYVLRTGLIDEYDRPWAVNELLKAMGMDAWEEPAETHERPLEDILKELLDDAAARGRIEDDTTNRDLFDTELMGRLTPRPSQVISEFRRRGLQHFVYCLFAEGIRFQTIVGKPRPHLCYRVGVFQFGDAAHIVH